MNNLLPTLFIRSVLLIGLIGFLYVAMAMQAYPSECNTPDAEMKLQLKEASETTTRRFISMQRSEQFTAVLSYYKGSKTGLGVLFFKDCEVGRVDAPFELLRKEFDQGLFNRFMGDDI